MIVDIKKVKGNTENPRVINDHKFKQLVKSIKEFPEMLKLRPIVVDEDMVVLGGNMRLKACKEAGLKEVSIKIAEGLTEEQKREFIVKDNVGFGEWDWDVLANAWDTKVLKEWGLELWQTDEDIDIDNLFEESTAEPKEDSNKIILEYTDEDYEIVIDALKNYKGSKESIIFNFLTGKE